MKILRIRRWWTTHEAAALRSAIILMAIAAGVWLSYEFWRLLFQTGYWGAIDLRNMRVRVGQWVGGNDVYELSKNALYPPASYLLVWPLLGWLSETAARWLWAVTTLLALGWLVYLTVEACGANTPRERLFVSLVPLSMYATGATIGNGQLPVHVIPVLITAILLLRRTPPGWTNDLIAAALMVVSLVKPNISAPFFLIVLFVPGRIRPSILAAAGYLGLSVFAASFQHTSLVDLLREWIVVGSNNAAANGTANLSVWLGSLGLDAWVLPAALLSLLILAGWIWQHRHNDLWILLGVTGIIARLWIYHFWYDDILLLLPMITLYRIARGEDTTKENSVVAGGLFGAMLLLMIAPGGLFLLPGPWDSVYQAIQVLVWLAAMVFLMLVSQTKGVANVRKVQSFQSSPASDN